jgi:8-oxo-dGTP pyrophosphatase MutT (NUDIX family)
MIVHMGSGILIIDNQGNVLILHRNTNVWQGDLWDIPGGKILDGQKSLDAAITKTKQEVGLQFEASELQLLEEFHFKTDGKDITFSVWVTYLDDLKPSITLNPDGHDSYTWENPHIALQKPDLMEGMYPILHKYLQKH